MCEMQHNMSYYSTEINTVHVQDAVFILVRFFFVFTYD